MCARVHTRVRKCVCVSASSTHARTRAFDALTRARTHRRALAHAYARAYIHRRAKQARPFGTHAHGIHACARISYARSCRMQARTRTHARARPDVHACVHARRLAPHAPVHSSAYRRSMGSCRFGIVLGGSHYIFSTVRAEMPTQPILHQVCGLPPSSAGEGTGDHVYY